VTPLQFEQLYGAEWDELEAQLRLILDRAARKKNREPLRAERVAALYRRACEHLALARARNYPRYLLDRLDRLTADAHQVIYQRRELGWNRVQRMFTRDFPRAVRAHATYVWVSAALLFVPMFLFGWMVYERPDLILSVASAADAAGWEAMYSDSADSIGRMRDANTDWTMFGYYIQHNISIAFQCFAAGILFCVGSIFFLVVNGVLIGGVAGYLTERGYSETFYSFVVTHGAFELTAIVLAGAAGLRLGYALLAPGRQTRLQSLVQAARESMVIVYGVIVMLLIAAAVEAFWSSARWLPLGPKYAIAALCWIAVLAYLAFQGRRED
jgi:uncharacterized membrane protein SpoIIM required for sporulation